MISAPRASRRARPHFDLVCALALQQIVLAAASYIDPSVITDSVWALSYVAFCAYFAAYVVSRFERWCDRCRCCDMVENIATWARWGYRLPGPICVHCKHVGCDRCR